MGEKPIDDGGPAFPIPETEWHYRNGGMSLRDHFAGLAMQAIIADCSRKDTSGFPTTEDFGTNNAAENCYETVANDAYAMADAMIRARKAEGGVE